MAPPAEAYSSIPFLGLKDLIHHSMDQNLDNIPDGLPRQFFLYNPHMKFDLLPSPSQPIPVHHEGNLK
jgi:hypothetical protein